MKKFVLILLTFALVLSMAACSNTPSEPNEPSDPVEPSQPSEPNTPNEPGEPSQPGETQEPETNPEEPGETPQSVRYDVNFAVLTGPTGVGAVKLMEANDAGETLNKYTVSAVADNSQIQNGLINGDYDIAAVATNVASVLYNKTEGQIQLLALNTLGVLYILERGETISSVADLKGKTIYSPGQGANPEYVLKYILSSNGLSYSTAAEEVPDADVEIVFDDASVIQTKMAAGEIDVAMLPVPAATAVLIQNQDVRSALDMTAEWDALGTGGKLTMGCVAVRTEYARENPEAVAQFLTDYEASINGVLADVEGAAALCESYGIVPKAAIAKRAIPDCNLTFVAGADVRPAIEPYYQVLFDANPASIGGAMPDDGFYLE